VLITNGNRTFDELLGDVTAASNGAVAGAPGLARFGRFAYVYSEMGGLQQRLNLRNMNVTPNLHSAAERWALSHNFYADPEIDLTGAHRFAGPLPGSGTIWRHLQRHEVPFLRFEAAGEKRDVDRARDFIAKMKDRQASGSAFPRYIQLDLPGARLAMPAPGEGYPYPASYVAANDHALGKVLEYLSHTPEWRQMLVLITDSDSSGGVDHIDTHRVMLVAAGPYVKKNYVSNTNANYAGLLKTILSILGAPPMTLFDATASDLVDLFTTEPDFTPHEFKPISKLLFEPEPGAVPPAPQ
jgi:hypothetical protein